MKTSPEHDELLNEILLGDSSKELRANSLDRSLTAIRQRRRLRCALRCAGPVAALGILTAIFWYRQTPTPRPVVGAMAITLTVPGTNIRVVNDEELLAMFPDRPVALVGPPENRQFVLLDEKRGSKTHDASRGKGQSL